MRNWTSQQHFLLFSLSTFIVLTLANEGDQNQTSVEISANGTLKNSTLDFDSGELAFEQEETRHELVIIEQDGLYNFDYFVECRGQNITSISALRCDRMDICEENKLCLLGLRECSSGILVTKGEECPWAKKKCFSVPISHYLHSGILQCTSEEAGVNRTTFDNFNVGESQATLLSNLKRNSSDLIKMKLYVSSLIEDLNDDTGAAPDDKIVSLYENEEVNLLECVVPSLLFHKEGVVFRVHLRDSSTNKSDTEKISFVSSTGYLKADLTEFRVPADLVSFSCAAQRINSSGEWLKNRINVTVRDLPSQVIVRSREGENITVNLTPGSKVNLHCEMTEIRKYSIWSQVRKMGNYYLWSGEPKSDSIIEFLRFHQVAGEHLICESMDEIKAKSTYKNSTWQAEHATKYGAEKQFHFLFNIAPSAPKIFNPLSPSSQNSSVHLIYQEGHSADQTLVCVFNGEPKPVVTWMKNGQKLHMAKSMGTWPTTDGKFQDGISESESMEYVKLSLNSKVIQMEDFDRKENGQAAHVNFSCVVSNHFGSDRLDFIIEMPQEFSVQPEKSIKIPTLEKSTVLTSTITTNPPSTIQTREDVGNSNPNSISKAHPVASQTMKENNKKSKPKDETFLFSTIFFSFVFLLALVVIVFIVQKKRKAVDRPTAPFGSGGIGFLRFRNLVGNDGQESMRNILVDERG